MSVVHARTIILAAVTAAVVAAILTGCTVTESGSTSSTNPVADRLATQPELPEGWPEEIAPPPGFTLEYAAGGALDGRTDFVAQYVAFGEKSESAAEYVNGLVAEGFAITDEREDIGLWALKGFGMLVQVIVDTSQNNLTWLAVTVQTSGD